MSLNNKQSVPAKTSVSPRPRKKIKTKDSGIPWIGEIPANWEVRKLKQMVEFPVEKAKENTPYIGLENIVGFTAKYIETNGVYDLSQALSCIPQDVLFGKLRPYLGKAYIVEKPSCCSGEFVIFRNAPNSKFLLFTILSDGFIEFVNASTYGAKMPRANPDFIRNMSIPVPPAGTQKRIAEFLDKKTAEIDALIALQEKMITELKSYKQSVITEAVTRGVPANIKTSHRDAEAQSVPVKGSGSQWIGCLPKSWNIVQAKYCITINHGSDPKTDGDIPVYGSGADSFKTCGEYKNGPVVLVGRKGATLHIPHYIKGKYWNVDTAFDVATNRLCHIKYYYYLAMSFDYKYYMSQTTLPGMTQSAYKNMYIPCPPYSEQEKIVVYLEEKCTQIDQFIALKQQKIETLQNYKKSIIFENVTGKNLL